MSMYGFRAATAISTLQNDSEIREYYAATTLRAARLRLRVASRLTIFSHSEGTKLGELLKPGRVAVLELGDVPDSVRTVVASVLLRRIHSERARASDAE